MKKHFKKALSLLLAVAMILSCLSCLSVFTTSAATIDDALAAATNYVKTNKNLSTKEGLLAAVQQAVPGAAITDGDYFYIKHAVPGVKDNTTDYPLNIAGSDGAVAALFELNGDERWFSCAFSHEEEVIEITETAVVGKSNGFTYDESGNVTAYTGTADKIVFPSGYSGTMKKLSDLSSANNVKVLIYDNSTALLSSAFANWDGLIAVQMNGTGTLALASDKNSKRETSMFANCDELKYFKFPDNVSNSYYWGSMFPESFLAGCAKLETLIMPKEAKSGSFNDYGYHPFYGTAVRDFDLPHCNKDATIKDTGTQDAFGGSKAVDGTRNINHYKNPMTFARAAALVAAKINECATVDEINGALSAVKGSADAETFKESLTLTVSENAIANDYGIKGSAELSEGSDTVTINFTSGKALENLQSNYAFSPAFDPMVNAYTSISVPQCVTSLDITATPAEGAVVGTITGNNLAIGENTVTIPVTTTDGKLVNYTISVTRLGDIPDAVKNAADAYVLANKNTVTAEGLLSAVRTVLPSISLNASDFYIKHAVSGVKDNTIDYPLNIAGSDGAVAAVFSYDGQSYGYSCAFSHEEEVIEITETAVVGTSTGFTYDESGNVTAYTGTADKIVFPSGYSGTMKKLSDLSSANNVKVLIYDNNTALLSSAFANWDGLIAVQMNGTGTLNLGSAVNNKREEKMFANCDELKYFKFPDNVSNSYIWGSMFPNDFLAGCAKLETLIMPKEAKSGSYNDYGYHTFYGTAVRDFDLPHCNKDATIKDTGTQDAFGGSKAVGGTRNINFYKNPMTFVRAAALVAAKVNELKDSVAADSLMAEAMTAIKGSADAENYRQTLSVLNSKPFTNTVFAAEGEALITDGAKFIPIGISKVKALTSLSVGYALNPQFSISCNQYTVTVPNVVTSVTVDAVPVEGATVKSITGNTNLQVGNNTVTVTVENTDGETVVYTITVIRKGVLNAEAAAAAKLYVDEAGNEATAEGLLAAVNTVLSNATLSDFFIKHAVPGATDNDTASGYPLNIPGSDGAVSAIITYNGVNYGFEASFGHEDEVITVDSFAIAGDPDYADYFEYDANNNIVNILKPVEKIILPEGYTGTVMYYTPVYNAQGQMQTPQCLFNNDSIINADRVKVVIINNQVALQNKAFYNWNGLKAVQFSDVQCKLFTEYNSLMQQFENCDALKYVKLPSTITSGWGNHLAGLAFKDCTKLENINIPEFTASKTMSPETFYCTNIRDFFLTKNITKSGDDNNVFRTLATGKVNRIYYTDNMTLARAAALIGSALYNANATTEADIKAIAKAAITGSHDSQQFADNTVFVWEENNSTNYMLNGILTVSNNGDDIAIPVSTAKALYSLSVDGYELSEKFDPSVTSYSVKLPYDASSLTVNAVLANGASVVTVDDDISDNTASVTILNTDGNNVVYSINVERLAEATEDGVNYLLDALLGNDDYAEVDVNKDGSFDVLDFITLKLRLENAAEAPALDSSEIMFVTAEENGIKSEDFISTVGYVSEDGTVTDTMFSAVAFNISNSITHIYEADPQNPNKTVARIRPMTKRDWSEMIHDYVFSDGYNVDALDKATGEVADTLGLDGYKVKVYLPLLYPSTEATNWGTLNGQQINLSVDADRIAAQKWMIDEYIAEFNKHNYKNLVLAGFYRAQESYRDGDDAFIPAVNAYISSMNLESIWVPYREAPGYNNATVLGYFDRVNMQLNYFPGRDDLPNASTDIKTVQKAIDMALENNMDGIQLELAAQGKEQIAGLKEYMKAGVTNGLMSKENSWWIWKDSETVNYLCDSDDEYIRSTYDEMYKFVKNTLTVAEINTNPGE